MFPPIGVSVNWLVKFTVAPITSLQFDATLGGMGAVSAHVAVAPTGGGLLSENTSAGHGLFAAVGATLNKVRLLDSPV